MGNFALIFLGGGAGSVVRYLMTLCVGHIYKNGSFPWHTLVVNLVGAFLIGAIVEKLSLSSLPLSPLRFFLITGFLGGFTTFSAFSVESALMIERGDYVQTGLYVMLSVLGTIALVFLGGMLVKGLSSSSF
jgi:CrcB protein